MNEQYIKKFLATEVLKKRLYEGTEEELYIRVGKYKIWKDPFDPFNNISHAFMVQDAIAKMDYEIKCKYMFYLDVEVSIISKLPMDFNIANANARQRTESAFRALATEEQQKEGGL